MTDILTPEERAAGWVEWRGGENPCRPDYEVPVIHRDGERLSNRKASEWRWKHWCSSGDIIAYKPEPVAAQTDHSALTDADKAELLAFLPPGHALRAKLGEPERTFEERVGAPWRAEADVVKALAGYPLLRMNGGFALDEREVLRTASAGPGGYALAKAVVEMFEPWERKRLLKDDGKALLASARALIAKVEGNGHD